MTLVFQENLKELVSKYDMNSKYPYENVLKFGNITYFNQAQSLYPSSNSKNFTVKLIEPKAENCKLFKAFLEEIYQFQNQYSKENSLLEIKEVFHEQNSNKFDIIQKDLNRNFRNEKGSIDEIGHFSLIREIMRFYYKLKEHTDLMKFLLDKRLGVMGLKIENSTYFRKLSKENNKKRLVKKRIMFDFLNFEIEMKEENESIFVKNVKKFETNEKTFENIHLAELKILILNMMFFEEKKLDFAEDFSYETVKKVIETAEKYKKFGVCTKNLINVLMNPDLNLKWDDLFQNPLLNVDIFLTKNKDQVKIWKIKKPRDNRIELKWLRFKTNSIDEIEYMPFDDDKEKTEKATPFKKNEVFEENEEIKVLIIEDFENDEKKKKKNQDAEEVFDPSVGGSMYSLYDPKKKIYKENEKKKKAEILFVEKKKMEIGEEVFDPTVNLDNILSYK